MYDWLIPLAALVYYYYYFMLWAPLMSSDAGGAFDGFGFLCGAQKRDGDEDGAQGRW
jgi:hypothetical protein